MAFTITANDTGYKEYVIDLSQNTNWTSKPNLNLIRFDVPMGAITGSEDKTVSVDYIKLGTTAPAGMTSLSAIDGREGAPFFKDENVNAGGGLVIIPNPVENEIRLELNTGSRYLKSRTFAMDGRLILECTGTITEINQKLNEQVSLFNQGIYVIKVEDEKKTHVQKFIKK